MTRTVVECDDDTGRPTVVIYKRSAAESAERQAARRAQAERGQAVARSLRSVAPAKVKLVQPRAKQADEPRALR